MTKKEVMSLLRDLIETEDNIKFIRIDKKTKIDLTCFLKIFGENDLTYSCLAKDCTDEWKNIFNDWNRKGILN